MDVGIRDDRGQGRRYGDGVSVHVDYNDPRLHASYDAGRTLDSPASARWTAAFTRHAPAVRPLTVLDLGSGTGRFTPPLAETFGGPVYGVEPSDGMRETAARDHAHPAVSYLAGRAEQLPLPDASVDLALIFFVFHHIADRPAAAAELARVLRPGGRLLLRSRFADRLAAPTARLLYRYFPGLRSAEARMFPTFDDTLDAFTPAGFSLTAIDYVEYQITDSLAAYHDRLRHRAISTFTYLSEDELTAGFTALATDARHETHPSPVRETAQLLALTRI